jgi:hypothetical protein
MLSGVPQKLIALLGGPICCLIDSMRNGFDRLLPRWAGENRCRYGNCTSNRNIGFSDT